MLHEVKLAYYDLGDAPHSAHGMVHPCLSVNQSIGLFSEQLSYMGLFAFATIDRTGEDTINFIVSVSPVLSIVVNANKSMYE